MRNQKVIDSKAIDGCVWRKRRNGAKGRLYKTIEIPLDKLKELGVYVSVLQVGAGSRPTKIKLDSIGCRKTVMVEDE